MRDTGGSPELLPAYRPASDEAARRGDAAPLGRAAAVVDRARRSRRCSSDGKLKALVVMNDNPLMLAPDRSRSPKGLESLDFLAVIDSLPTDTAKLAHAVLADVSALGARKAPPPAPTAASSAWTRPRPRRARPSRAGASSSDLGARLAERLNAGEIRIRYQTASRDHGRDVAGHPALRQRHLPRDGLRRPADHQQPVRDGRRPAKKAERQAVPVAKAPRERRASA